jgi:hypothetical protein
MRKHMKHVKHNVGHGLSRFLVTYLVMLFGALMLVHALQAQGTDAGGSSRSPVHQDRQRSTAAADARFG